MGKKIKIGKWVRQTNEFTPTITINSNIKTDITGLLNPTILQEAQGIVYGDRQASYGKASTNFGRIARMWEEILDSKVTPEQVGMCMIAVKLARQCHKPSRDNLVDIAGYAATIEKVQKGE